ncbi:MAG TPA: DUF4129 domain-containing protein [Actinomycetes bacterium]
MADVRRSRRRGPRAPVALLALAAAALLALVAVGAARGPLGSGAGRPTFPSDLVATLVLLLLVAGAATLVLAVVVLGPDRRMLRPRRQRNSILTALLPLALLVAVWLFHEPLRQLGERMRGGAPVTTLPVLEAPEPSVTPAPPGPLPLLVAGLAVVAMAAIVAAGLLADRRRRVPPRTRAERLVELLDDTLDDIERDPDPRRAVIAAWARMERGLAAAGLPRAPAEAPFEYVARVLAASLDRPGHPLGVPRTPPVRPASVHRLTDLFERAKFSRHTIDHAMRQEAVAALRAVRSDLAAAARAEEGADTAPAGR